MTSNNNLTRKELAVLIIDWMKDKNFVIFRKKKEVNIVYVEGMNIDGTLNPDCPNKFNDVRMIVEFKNNQVTPEITAIWQGTTEPGEHYTINPMNSKGAARIKFGQYQAWRVGMHGNSDRHEALIQVMPVSVHRDLDKNYIRTGDKIDTGLFGINQHWGYDFPSDDIETASAGCLVGRTRASHEIFMFMVKQDPKYKKDKNHIFHTTIIPGNQLIAFRNKQR